MKIYKHEGNGHYVGSYIVVLAESRENAEAIIFQELIDNGLRDEPLNITEYELTEQSVILSVNGDY